MSDVALKDKLLQVAKPILFNTEMVKAILEGRKTVTRRCVKYKYSNTEMKMRTDKYGTCLVEIQKDVEGETFGKNEDGTTWQKLLPFIEKIPPFKKGNILYVRETWTLEEFYNDEALIRFRAGGSIGIDYEGDTYSKLLKYADKKWNPSLFMPKEAARIFLKVKDVRVERLQDITGEQAVCEGTKETFPPLAVDEFRDIWNSTINKSDLELYGWDANPYVWVIEFERNELDCEV